MPNGLPVLPARGVNAEMLFAEKIDDPQERFRRLENAVMDLRREFDSVNPAIVRLSAVESDMQQLLNELETLVQGGPAPQDMTLDSAPVDGVTLDALPDRPFPEAPEQTIEPIAPQPALPAIAPVASAPVQSPPPAAPRPEEQATAPPEPLAQGPPPQATPPPEPKPAPVAPEPAKLSGPAVVAVRTGQQPGGVTRLVLDLDGPATHHSDLDNSERLLLIEMPKARWSAAPNGTFADAPLLVSWTTEPLADGQGVRLILQLRHTVKLVSDSTLGNPSRIVLDLKKSP